MSEVKVGQVWADNDPRNTAGVRHIEIRQIVSNSYAICWSYYNNFDMRRKVRIKLTRFKPTASGYRLLTDVPSELIISTRRETK